jgi:hypothetical protein
MGTNRSCFLPYAKKTHPAPLKTTTRNMCVKSNAVSQVEPGGGTPRPLDLQTAALPERSLDARDSVAYCGVSVKSSVTLLPAGTFTSCWELL